MYSEQLYNKKQLSSAIRSSFENNQKLTPETVSDVGIMRWKFNNVHSSVSVLVRTIVV